MGIVILGGTLKGGKIDTPKTSTTRPSTSLLKKSLFDSCQGELIDAYVCDLFAGSGALGIESLSRNASHAYFVDTNGLAIKCIRKNVISLKLEKASTIIRKDALSFAHTYNKQAFDIIFIDPPYAIDLSYLDKLSSAIAQNQSLITKDSLIFLEIGTRGAKKLKDLPNFTEQWQILKEKTSKTTTLFKLQSI